MKKEIVETKLKQIFSELFLVNETDISEDTSPENTSNWDSIQHISLIIVLEEQFKIVFEPKDIAEMLNFALVREIVLEKLTQ